MAVADDEIIRRRLLIEGDGGMDDRRIGSLLKTFIKWSNSSDSAEDSNAVYQKMTAQLAQCEQAVEKSVEVHKMNIEEQKHYEDLNSKIEQSIKDAFDKISKCKTELHQAKRVRHNRQEYDALAKVIQQHPDRKETMKKLESLDEELKELKESKQSTEEKLDLRRKQFHVLISAIHEMQRILDEDEQKDDNNISMETN